MSWGHTINSERVAEAAVALFCADASDYISGKKPTEADYRKALDKARKALGSLERVRQMRASSPTPRPPARTNVGKPAFYFEDQSAA